MSASCAGARLPGAEHARGATAAHRLRSGRCRRRTRRSGTRSTRGGRPSASKRPDAVVPAPLRRRLLVVVVLVVHEHVPGARRARRPARPRRERERESREQPQPRDAASQILRCDVGEAAPDRARRRSACPRCSAAARDRRARSRAGRRGASARGARRAPARSRPSRPPRSRAARSDRCASSTCGAGASSEPDSSKRTASAFGST